MSSSLRVLHIGNIANNAYNIAKALREKSDIEADCFTNAYNHYISQPEWEDADIEESFPCDDFHAVDWSAINLHGFQRPEWYFETNQELMQRICALPFKPSFLRMPVFVQSEGILSEFAEYWKKLCQKTSLSQKEREHLRALFQGKLPLNKTSFPTRAAWVRYLKRMFRQLCMPPHRALTSQDYLSDSVRHELALLFQHYDIIQTYGAWEPFLPVLHTPSIPRVTFEHGTMRDFPFQGTALGRKTMLAYKTAFANIITNADSIHNMRRMGLKNCVFIPHPVDDSKFCPQADPAFRKALLEELEATHLFLAPARQNWDIKGNDRIIRGFAHFLRSVGPGPRLLLGAWGQEVERSQALARELGISDHVTWLPPLPKRLLARYINACDAVLDQFILGAFGTTTPEAMACAKPVLLFYKSEDHRWCLPEDPPVLNVQTEEEIAQALRKLYDDPVWAQQRGQQSLAWFRKYHSLDVVVERHRDIYQRIAQSRHCFVVNIPKKEPSMYTNIICAVDASELSHETMKRWLDKIQQKTALEILDFRLRQMHQHIHFIIFIADSAPAVEAEARRLGWDVLRPPFSLRNLARQCSFSLLKKLWRMDCAYICTPDQPFMDKEQITAWRLIGDNRDKIISGESKNTNPYIPLKFYSRNFIIYRYLLQKLFRHHFTHLQCQSIMVRYGINVPPPALPQGTPALTFSTFMGIAPHFDATRFTFQEVRALPSEKELLLKNMTSAQQPHILNARLNEIEIQEKKEELQSFPPYVGLNLTSRCSARCVFCSIQPDQQKVKDRITLEEIQRMDWLRYVQRLSIWGGIGDSLVNKDFLPIVRYLKETYPHLELDLSTNGILLTEELCQELAGSLTRFNVSLNAATKETWEKMMRAKGFEHICAMYARLASLCSSRTQKPVLSLSMVATRDNIHEAVPFVELAHKLGAGQAIFGHYVSTTLVGKRDLTAEHSLYFDQRRSDQELQKAVERGTQLGIEVVTPLAFQQQAEFILFGARSKTQAPACTDPWKTCYLTVDEDGQRQMIFCCSGFYYSIGYDKANLDEEQFRLLWNHPTARFFRRTVNTGANPVCQYCTTVDRFNPDNRELYDINDKIQPYFAAIDQQYRESGKADIENMAQDIADLLKK